MNEIARNRPGETIGQRVRFPLALPSFHRLTRNALARAGTRGRPGSKSALPDSGVNHDLLDLQGRLLDRKPRIAGGFSLRVAGLRARFPGAKRLCRDSSRRSLLLDSYGQCSTQIRNTRFELALGEPRGCPHCDPVGSPRLSGFLDDNRLDTDPVVKKWIAWATVKRVSLNGAIRQSFISYNFRC